MKKLITEEDIMWVDAWAHEMRTLMKERGNSGPPRALRWSDVQVSTSGRNCVWSAPNPCRVCNGYGTDMETGQKCECGGLLEGGVKWRMDALNRARIPAHCINIEPNILLGTTAKWVEEWRPSARGYILLGDKGTGKTSYMVAMVKAFIQANVPARMVDWPTFISERKSKMGNQIALDAQMEVFGSCPVLCIDELARERGTEWTEELLDAVIELRYQSGHTTIVASNADAKGFEEYMGPRLYSRLAQMCRVVPFNGVDRRQK